jgi:hypothetical protein
MDAGGNVLARQRERTPAAFAATHETLQSYLELKAKAAAGDASVAPRLFVTELELGALTLEEAQKRRAELGQLPDELARQVDALITSLEFTTLAREMQGRDLTKRAAAGAKIVRLYQSGWRPKEEFPARMFFSLVMAHAESEGDAALFAKAFADFEAKVGKDPRMKPAVDRARERLEKLQDADQ